MERLSVDFGSEMLHLNYDSLWSELRRPEGACRSRRAKAATGRGKKLAVEDNEPIRQGLSCVRREDEERRVSKAEEEEEVEVEEVEEDEDEEEEEDEVQV
ncbi:hypothetical protein TESG_00757 [Trichophyton tonsurans CBS 112818]|uniref:Uncharacterized protein n=1 Tax=Trichophyton tonsurans (strain CBS 112818) TaxID=647933 RepID=F2RPF2_TRIT1|nr:hypothetical protein TESG_00757 [Trichophyton tonsurans CBS 112818]